MANSYPPYYLKGNMEWVRTSESADDTAEEESASLGNLLIYDYHKYVNIKRNILAKKEEWIFVLIAGQGLWRSWRFVHGDFLRYGMRFSIRRVIAALTLDSSWNAWKCFVGRN